MVVMGMVVMMILLLSVAMVVGGEHEPGDVMG